MPIKPELMTELFEQAAQQEMGLVVEVENPHYLQVQLSEHRKAAGRWSDLMILQPSTANTIIIAHKSVELD